MLLASIESYYKIKVPILRNFIFFAIIKVKTLKAKISNITAANAPRRAVDQSLISRVTQKSGNRLWISL